MGKPHPIELRQRVVDHVAEGNTHRSAAARFKVSVRFVNDMVKLMKATGGLAPKAQGNGGGHGKLSSLKDWIARRIAQKRDLTAAGLAAEITATHGMAVHRGSVWRLLRDLGLTHKKDLQAVEQKRPEVAAARHIWITKRQPFMANMLTRIGFIDESEPVMRHWSEHNGERSRPTWPRPPAGPRAGNGWSITRPSATGTADPGSSPGQAIHRGAAP